jgi:multidrug efflux pump subunit AcrA (membrane-fusion protein)
VFVVDANNIAQFRMVRLGEHMNGQAEVQAGLTAGERIVSDGASKIETGDKIGG